MKSYFSALLLLGIGTLAVAACAGEPEPGPPGAGDTPQPEPTTPPVGDTADTGTPDTTPETTAPYEFDCTSVPATAGPMTPVAAARGSYDLAFDTLGNIVGWDNGLMKADYYGNGQIFSPPVGNVQGMDWLPDGDLVVAEIDTRALIRVDGLTGGTSLISSDVGAYGVKVGPDGMIYAGTDQYVMRVDPVTGERTLLVDDARFNARSIDFSPDFSKLYMGTYLGDGRFWAVDLDVNLDPIGDPYVFAANVGNGTEHDAVGVDICGNVLVIDYGTLTMYRLTPAGQQSIVVEFNGEHYGHGITWGSGIGGWNTHAIYLPEPWFGNTVFEMDIGVPSRSYVP